MSMYQLPYGYMMVENKQEQRNIELIMDLYHNHGLTAWKICRHLNDTGVPTRGGAPWRHSTVVSILQREFRNAYDKHEKKMGKVSAQLGS